MSAELMTIPERFARQVASTPDALAITAGADRYTYRELGQAVERVAREIVALGIPRGATVAVHAPRGPEPVILAMAALRAGTAFLPLDVGFPPERLHLMIKDANCKAVLTFGAAPPGAVSEHAAHADLRATLEGAPDSCMDALVPLPTDPNDLAYVIYTSGSTGKPKGVLTPHRGIPLLADSFLALCRRGGGDVRRMFQFFSPSFDAWVFEIMCTLLNGLELVVGPLSPAETECDELLDQLDRDGVDYLVTTPSYLATGTPRPRPGLQTIALVGEASPVDLVRRWLSEHRLMNLYGPTEATIGATGAYVDGAGGSVPIGWPLDHVDVFLLDADRRSVGDGERGEIYLGGPAVGLGYVNLPEETAAAFVEGPAEGGPSRRLYRTGDFGLVRPDGQIEFLGRADGQVKLRGYRIELGEVEAALRSCDQVADAAAVVVADSDSERALVGVVRWRTETGGDEELVREVIARRLPPYMVPKRVVALEAFPLRPSGKLDRRALAERVATRDSDPAAAVASAGFSAPRDDTPLAVVTGIWREALGVDEIHAETDFFAAGGHSLLATRVVSRVRRHFEIELSLRTLFAAPTLGDFAAAVERALVEQAGDPSTEI